MANWLVKSEPSCYSISDLKKDSSTAWEGVRNYQARNNLRAMKKGEKVLFYHSVDDPIGIAGIAKVIKEAYPDPLQFNKKSEYFDVAASKEKSRWFCPDLSFVKIFENVLPLSKLKTEANLNGLVLLQKGSRLSVQPVSDEHFNYILRLAL
jgi:predicted RNA-binding protein with PUA-like domain